MPRVFDSSSYGKVPLPNVLGGAFFVLEWERESATYVLTVDDQDHSTYDLGDDLDDVRNVFVQRGYPVDRVNDLIDQAREFGASQYIPSLHTRVPDRVLPILPRGANRAVLSFEPPTNARYQQLR